MSYDQSAADLITENRVLKELARESLDARNAEAKALMAWDNARNNFMDDSDERREYNRAAIAASKADEKLRAAIGG